MELQTRLVELTRGEAESCTREICFKKHSPMLKLAAERGTQELFDSWTPDALASVKKTASGFDRYFL